MESNSIGSHFFERAYPRGGEWPEEGVVAPATRQEEGATERGYPAEPPITYTMLHNIRFISEVDKYISDSEHDCSYGHSTAEHSNKASGMTGALSAKLANTHKGPVGPKHSEWPRNHLHIPASSGQKATPSAAQPIAKAAGAAGDLGIDLERGSTGVGRGTRGRICFHPVSGTKKRWRPEASHKSEKSQLLCRCPTFQNGGDSYTQKLSPGGGLASKSILKGCLLLSSNQSKTQEISLFPIRGQILPVQLSPLRPGLSPMGLYQDPEAGSSSRSGVRNTDGCLHRRHSPDGRDQGESQRSSVRPDISVTVPGFHSKHGKDSVRTGPMPRVPGFHGRHHQDGAKSASSKDKKDSGGVQTVVRGGAGYSPRPLQINWQDERHESSDPTGTPVLQEPTNGPGNSSERSGPGLRDSSRSIPRQPEGTDLVGHPNDNMEWQDGVDNGAKPDHRIGCLNPGLGSVPSRHQYWGALVPPGEGMAHKLPRIASDNSSTEDLREEKEGNVGSIEDRQHDHSCLYQQPEGTVSKELVSLTRDLWMWCL